MATASLPCLPILDKKSGNYCTKWTSHYPADHATQPGKAFTDYHSFETKDLDRANERYLKFLNDRAKGSAAAVAGQRTVHWCIDYYIAKHLDGGTVVNVDDPKRVLAAWKKYFGPKKMMHEVNKVDPDHPDLELDMDRWARLRRTDRRWNTGKAVRKDGTEKDSAPLADGTLRYEKNIFKTCRNYCVKKGMLSNLALPVIELGPPPKGRSGTIDEDQFMALQALLLEANSPRMPDWEGKYPGIFIWAWLMFMTGARTNEAQWLKWDKVDLDRTLTIDYSLDDRPVTCKVRNEEAPIPDALLPILRRAKAEAVTEWVCVKPITFGSSFKDYCEKAGFPITGRKKITAHSMRHSRITLAVAAGMEAGEASDLFRLDITTMMETYYHGTAKKRRENANRSLDQKTLMRASIKAVK